MKSFTNSLVLALVLLVGCSHTPTEEELKAQAEQPAATDLADNESDMSFMPTDMNQNVQKWITYFQGRGRPHMEVYLKRSGRYIPLMKEILKSHGLPEDLVYLAMIESGFNSKAHSSASAVGFWQFIRGTAKRYGLRMSYYEDDRRDFIKSTQAAALYLKGLYNLFGSWYLAMASYNAGENRIKGLVMRNYTRDFWELARNKKLPSETQNYIPKFLAARLISKHPEQYGFSHVVLDPAFEYQSLITEKSVNLKTMAQKLGMPLGDLKDLNPSFKRGLIPIVGKEPREVRVPKTFSLEIAKKALEQSSKQVAINKAYARVDEEFIKYRIRPGDTLSGIADKHGVGLSALLRANGLSKRSMIRAGKKIRVPKRFKRTASLKTNQKGEKVHVVRAGETLIEIAKRYGIQLSQLIKANDLKSKHKIYIGDQLRVPKL